MADDWGSLISEKGKERKPRAPKPKRERIQPVKPVVPLKGEDPALKFWSDLPNSTDNRADWLWASSNLNRCRQTFPGTDKPPVIMWGRANKRPPSAQAEFWLESSLTDLKAFYDRANAALKVADENEAEAGLGAGERKSIAEIEKILVKFDA